MERLTPKNYKDINLMGSWIPPTIKNAMWNKLGKLEDLEEQIGCPLEVRCNLYEGQHIFDKDGVEFVIRQIGKHDFYKINVYPPHLKSIEYMKGYKKTWWLKEDKSE